MNDYTRNMNQDKPETQLENLAHELRSFLHREDTIILIGLGNEFRSDDGAGIAAIRHLQKIQLDENTKLMLIEAGRNLVTHLFEIVEAKPSKLIFIDAADIGRHGGAVKIFYKKQLVERTFSTHENNLGLALTYLEAIVPDCQVLFLGIQYTSLEMSENLSLTKEVEKGVEQVFTAIKHIVETFNK
jgi:hydrogenase maturation protease